MRIHRHTRAQSPAFAVGGLGYEPEPGNPGTGRLYIPRGGWACFHCGERFTSIAAATAHFGEAVDVLPICVAVAYRCDDVREAFVRRVLEAQILQAICDPGNFPGPFNFKGERTLQQWQTDAVMAVLDGGAK